MILCLSVVHRYCHYICMYIHIYVYTGTPECSWYIHIYIHTFHDTLPLCSAPILSLYMYVYTHIRIHRHTRMLMIHTHIHTYHDTLPVCSNLMGIDIVIIYVCIYTYTYTHTHQNAHDTYTYTYIHTMIRCLSVVILWASILLCSCCAMIKARSSLSTSEFRSSISANTYIHVCSSKYMPIHLHTQVGRCVYTIQVVHLSVCVGEQEYLCEYIYTVSICPYKCIYK